MQNSYFFRREIYGHQYFPEIIAKTREEAIEKLKKTINWNEFSEDNGWDVTFSGFQLVKSRRIPLIQTSKGTFVCFEHLSNEEVDFFRGQGFCEAVPLYMVWPEFHHIQPDSNGLYWWEPHKGQP